MYLRLIADFYGVGSKCLSRPCNTDFLASHHKTALRLGFAPIGQGLFFVKHTRFNPCISRIKPLK